MQPRESMYRDLRGISGSRKYATCLAFGAALLLAFASLVVALLFAYSDHVEVGADGSIYMHTSARDRTSDSVCPCRPESVVLAAGDSSLASDPIRSYNQLVAAMDMIFTPTTRAYDPSGVPLTWLPRWLHAEKHDWSSAKGIVVLVQGSFRYQLTPMPHMDALSIFSFFQNIVQDISGISVVPGSTVLLLISRDTKAYLGKMQSFEAQALRRVLAYLPPFVQVRFLDGYGGIRKSWGTAVGACSQAAWCSHAFILENDWCFLGDHESRVEHSLAYLAQAMAASQHAVGVRYFHRGRTRPSGWDAPCLYETALPLLRKPRPNDTDLPGVPVVLTPGASNNPGLWDARRLMGRLELSGVDVTDGSKGPWGLEYELKTFGIYSLYRGYLKYDKGTAMAKQHAERRASGRPDQAGNRSACVARGGFSEASKFKDFDYLRDGIRRESYAEGGYGIYGRLGQYHPLLHLNGKKFTTGMLREMSSRCGVRNDPHWTEVESLLAQLEKEWKQPSTVP